MSPTRGQGPSTGTLLCCLARCSSRDGNPHSGRVLVLQVLACHTVPKGWPPLLCLSRKETSLLGGLGKDISRKKKYTVTQFLPKNLPAPKLRAHWVSWGRRRSTLGKAVLVPPPSSFYHGSVGGSWAAPSGNRERGDVVRGTGMPAASSSVPCLGPHCQLCWALV